MAEEKTELLPKTHHLKEKLQSLLLLRNELWVLAMINIDGLKQMNAKLGYHSTNDKILHTGQIMDKYCKQMEHRMILFKHNEISKGDIFAILFDCKKKKRNETKERKKIKILMKKIYIGLQRKE